MGKQLNPLEKEFLIKQYRRKQNIRLVDFCAINDICEASMKKWMAQYDAEGIEGLSRGFKDPLILPANVERTEENYRKEILKLRIENERLKKNYTVQKDENGEIQYIRLKEKTTK